MAEHTKGPFYIDVNGSEKWTVDYDGPSSTYMTICARGRGEPVGFVVEPTAFGNDEEIEANARLFAAAPDLLEAVWALIEHFERVDGDAEHKAVIAKGTAAIARATTDGGR